MLAFGRVLQDRATGPGRAPPSRPLSAGTAAGPPRTRQHVGIQSSLARSLALHFRSTMEHRFSVLSNKLANRRKTKGGNPTNHHPAGPLAGGQTMRQILLSFLLADTSLNSALIHNLPGPSALLLEYYLFLQHRVEQLISVQCKERTPPNFSRQSYILHVEPWSMSANELG
jgi:hypothetical protein